MRIVCISDLHCNWGGIEELPEGDMLIVAGDISNYGYRPELERFEAWGKSLKDQFKYRIMVSGNHDDLFMSNPREARNLIPSWQWLNKDTIEIEGLTIHGISWQDWFWKDIFARKDNRFQILAATIPYKLDILITHRPPWGILDQATNGTFTGDSPLLDRVLQVKPKIHIFGHIHESYGQERVEDIKFINACTCNVFNRPINQPIVIEV